MPKIPLSTVDKAVERGDASLKMPTAVGLDDVKWAVTSTPAARNSQPYQNRRVCAGNTNCIPICPIQAKYDPSVTLADAMRTGHRRRCWYRRVAVEGRASTKTAASAASISSSYDDDNGRVTSAAARDRPRQDLHPGRQRHRNAEAAVDVEERAATRPTASPTAATARVVGKYLMDHPLYLAWALAPKPVWGYRGPLSTAGIEICRDGEFRRDRGAFRIEIGNEGWNFAIGDPDTTTRRFRQRHELQQGSMGRGEALFGPALVARL